MFDSCPVFFFFLLSTELFFLNKRIFSTLLPIIGWLDEGLTQFLISGDRWSALSRSGAIAFER